MSADTAAIKIVKLSTSDGAEFHVPRDVIKQSVTINTLLTDLGIDAEDTDSTTMDAIPLQNVTGHIMKKVITYCEHHKDDSPAAEDLENRERRTDNISAWDVEFLNVDQGTLFELILAANYLDIKSLLDVTCKAVANMIKGKTPEEIRRTFNINNDFTPEEEEQNHRENAWCED